MEQLRALDGGEGGDGDATRLEEAFEGARRERKQVLADISRAEEAVESCSAEAAVWRVEESMKRVEDALRHASPVTRDFLGLEACTQGNAEVSKSCLDEASMRTSD